MGGARYAEMPSPDIPGCADWAPQPTLRAAALQRLDHHRRTRIVELRPNDDGR